MQYKVHQIGTAYTPLHKKHIFGDTAIIPQHKYYTLYKLSENNKRLSKMQMADCTMYIIKEM